jgi:visual pigment-like receptor peropsin
LPLGRKNFAQLSHIYFIDLKIIIKHLFFSKAKFRDKYNYYKWINAVWIYALFWALMPLIGWGRYNFDPSITTCTIDWRHNDTAYKSFIIFYFIFGFVIPLSIIFYCYFVIVKKVKTGSIKRGNAGINGEDIWVQEKTVTIVRYDKLMIYYPLIILY